nr:putative sulfate exporter family transporter [Suipraeoptans intestinalis]
MWKLGSETLDKAVLVKLTRTLAIIPITLLLSFVRAKQRKKMEPVQAGSVCARHFPCLSCTSSWRQRSQR